MQQFVAKSKLQPPRLDWTLRIESAEAIRRVCPDGTSQGLVREIEANVFRASTARGKSSLPTRYADILRNTLDKIESGIDSRHLTAVPFLSTAELMSGSSSSTLFRRRARDTQENESKIKDIIDEFTSSLGDGSSPFAVRCRRCGATGDDVQEVDAQTRSADEGASVLGLCLKCGLRWKS